MAFVVARCGTDVVGGAESLCFQVATRLAHEFEIDILTTCARDYRTWADTYEPGEATIAGVRVRRFRVDAPREPRSFDRLSRAIASDPERTSRADEERWTHAQGPVSTALVDYVRAHEDEYETFAFFGYLYATTSLVLSNVARKAILISFAHDEWMLRLPMWDGLFAAPRAIVCVSREERELLGRRFSNAAPVRVIDVGVEAPAGRDASRFRRRFSIDGPFLLALGRVDRAKGIDVLVDDFRRYRSATSDPLQLVIVGTNTLGLRGEPGIRVLGALEDADKWDAFEACDLLVVPSEFESLSLALLEAWACVKPVLVTARSSVLVAQCRRANGGVWYSSYEAFASALRLLDPRLRRSLGENGHRYVTATYDWERARIAFADALCGEG